MLMNSILPIVVLLALACVIYLMNWRSESTSNDKGQVSDSWLAANRATNRTTD